MSDITRSVQKDCVQHTHSSFMSDLDMDAATSPLDPGHAPFDVIACVLQSMSLSERFTCALVCKAWAEVAAATTRSIIIRHRVQDLSCLQRWLEKHGKHVKVFQLHQCDRATLTALPCPQLQDLLLHSWDTFDIDSRVWVELAAATKLTSVTLRYGCTAAQPAGVVSALTALPDLQQLTWCDVRCSGQRQLSDSLMLQQMTQLTALQLEDVTAAALQHLGSLTKLQYLSVTAAEDWAAAGCPGLQELKALTRLKLLHTGNNMPASVIQLTALQQLSVSAATATALNGLQALTSLTQLCVQKVTDLSAESPPLQLPGLQHLELNGQGKGMPMSFLSRCTQLRVLCMQYFFIGPGRLASNLLHRLELQSWGIYAADGAAAPMSWQQVFSGQLPHLTSLALSPGYPALQQADIECVVACCSSLQVLHLGTLKDSFASALARLSGLTSLLLRGVSDQQCSSLAQLTGLRELGVGDPWDLSTVGLRQLAALEQLTSLAVYGGFDPDKVSDVLQLQVFNRLQDCFAIINKVCEEGRGLGSWCSTIVQVMCIHMLAGGEAAA